MAIEVYAQTRAFAALPACWHKRVGLDPVVQELFVLALAELEKLLQTVMLFFVKPKGKEFWLFGEVVLVDTDILECAGVNIVELLTYRLMEG